MMIFVYTYCVIFKYCKLKTVHNRVLPISMLYLLEKPQKEVLNNWNNFEGYYLFIYDGFRTRNPFY